MGEQKTKLATQQKTIHTKAVKNKYRVSYKYTYTHTIKITKIILGKGIADQKLIFYTPTMLIDIAPYLI